MKETMSKDGVFLNWFQYTMVAVSAIYFGYLLATIPSENKTVEKEQVSIDSVYSDYFPEWEVLEIMDACHRNRLEPQLVPIVFAIRKAENGVTKPFGIMNPEADTYSKQAGWCVCTVQKNYDRWLKDSKSKEFIAFLGNRYCPAEVDIEGNENWKRNVKYWTNKFNEKAGECNEQ